MGEMLGKTPCEKCHAKIGIRNVPCKKMPCKKLPIQQMPCKKNVLQNAQQKLQCQKCRAKTCLAKNAGQKLWCKNCGVKNAGQNITQNCCAKKKHRAKTPNQNAPQEKSVQELPDKPLCKRRRAGSCSARKRRAKTGCVRETGQGTTQKYALQ